MRTPRFPVKISIMETIPTGIKTKAMKTRLTILFAAIFLTGCTRTEIFHDNSLTATIDCGVNTTKAILIDNPGYRLDSRWQDAERIGVFGDGASNIEFCVSGADISTDGKSAKFRTTSDIPGGSLAAYSPYQADAKPSGSDIAVTIPAVQKYITVNGVVQPDPISNIMAAAGSANTGLTFRNAMAVLKIGQFFDKATTLKKIEFRDLSGAAVCGAATLSWNGGSPEAAVVGNGAAITLDCGEGLEFTEGRTGIFFIIVPAREYPKGFELTFIDSEGGRTVKTAGTAKGKRLDRSIVYLIGNVSAGEAPEGTSSTLKSTATLMTPEIMDNVIVQSASGAYVTDENGNRISIPGHADLRMPRFDMVVPKELGPAVGNYLVFDHPTDDLPNGGVYKIVKCTKLNEDLYEIVAHPETNVAAPFEELKAGEPLVGETGEIIAGGGLPIDLTSHVASIKDMNGNAVQFSVADGKILLSEETVAEMFGIQTKSVSRNSFSTPKLSLNSKKPNLEISVGGYLSLDTRLAVRYMQGEFQYMQFTITPEITTSLSACSRPRVILKNPPDYIPLYSSLYSWPRPCLYVLRSQSLRRSASAAACRFLAVSTSARNSAPIPLRTTRVTAELSAGTAPQSKTTWYSTRVSAASKGPFMHSAASVQRLSYPFTVCAGSGLKTT